MLEMNENGADGKIHLTDAMTSLIVKQLCHGVTFERAPLPLRVEGGLCRANLMLALERVHIGDHIRSVATKELARWPRRPPCRVYNLRKGNS